MEKLNIQYYVPNDFSKYFDPKKGTFKLKDVISIDNSRPGYKGKWTTPGKLDPHKYPSSLVMDDKIIQSGLPILSVVVDEDDLYDERTGIFTNHQQKGKKWERLSYLSYYNNGKLLFASGAGVRVHGGGDRSMKYKGLRFYFRNIYGAKKFKGGILFSKESEPIRRIIVRREPAFLNALALDISKQIGCIAPYSQPVKVYFNGKLYDDNFVLTEHISNDYLYSMYGHENFIIERTIKRRRIRSRSNEFKELRDWASDKSIKMTMAEAQKKVDIENLSLWWISQLYCADTDHYQGPAVLDISKKDSKWFWINWDMDQSFKNKREKNKHIWEQELCLYEVMNKINKLDREDPRGILFRRMMNEDPIYRTYFENLLTEALNHRLTKEFIEKRIHYYEEAGKALGIKTFEGYNVHSFVENRHAYLRELMQKYFNAPQSYQCKVRVAKLIRYKVDDYTYKEDYQGRYFKGSQIEVTIPNINNKKVKYWLVNGKKVKTASNRLRYTVDSDTIIEPVVTNYK